LPPGIKWVGKKSALWMNVFVGPADRRWQGNALWRILQRGLQSGHNEVPRAEDGLGALYAQ